MASTQETAAPDKAPGGDTAEDRVDRAYRLMMSEPGTPQAVEAAERAAEMAGVLTIASDTPDNQRRLARGLWYSTSAHTAAKDVPAAAKSAKLSPYEPTPSHRRALTAAWARSRENSKRPSRWAAIA